MAAIVQHPCRPRVRVRPGSYSPRVSIGQKRTHRIETFVSSVERAAIEEAAAEAGMRVSAYVRARALLQPTSNRALVYAFGRLTAEAGRIGNNLNQLTRWANATGGTLPELAIIEEIRSELKSVIAELRAAIVIERPRRSK